MPFLDDDFSVPMFLGREAKLFGPFSFRQFVLGSLTTIALLLNLVFVIPNNFLLGLLIFFLLVFFGYGSAFIRIANKSLPSFTLTFISFSIAPKKYLWRKETIKKEVLSLFPEVEENREKEEEHPALETKGNLDRLMIQLETGQNVE